MSLCLNSVLSVKAVVAAFNQEKALVGAFSVITNLRMELFEALGECDHPRPAAARAGHLPRLQGAEEVQVLPPGGRENG